MGVLFGTVHQIGVPSLLCQPVSETVAVIVGRATVLVDHRELIAEHVFDPVREIAGVLAALLIAYSLYLRIERRIDLETAAVKKRICLFLRFSRVILKILEELVLKRVDKVGVDPVVFHLLLNIHFPDSGIYVVCQRRFVVLL